MAIHDYVRKNSFKILICGNGAVGKTTIGKKISGNFNANENIEMTTGIEFHNLTIPSKEPIDCQLWDLGGQDQFREFQDNFFDSATIVVLIFAVNMYNSYMKLSSWKSLISKEILEKTYLIANKIDASNRSVPKQKGLEFALKNNMAYFEISALTGEGIEKFKSDLINTIKTICLAKD